MSRTTRALAPDEEHLLAVVARRHLETPSLWDPGNVVADQAVDRTVVQVREAVAAGSAALLATVDGEDLLGFLWVARQGGEYGPEGHVVSIWTAPAARGTGVATGLLAAAEDWVRDQGLDAITSNVHLRNDAMLRLSRECHYAEEWVTFRKRLGRGDEAGLGGSPA